MNAFYKKMNRSKSLLVLAVSILLTVLLSILFLNFFKSLGKNNYELSSEYDKQGSHYFVTIDVEQPAEETIIFRSSNDMAVSMEALENFQAKEVQLAAVPDDETGVKLKIKSADKKVQIKLPIPIMETGKQKFELVRNGKVIQTHQVDISAIMLKEQLETKESEEKGELLAYEESESASYLNLVQTRQSQPKIQLLAEDPSATAIVKNYSELTAAVASDKFSRIEFAKDITATTSALANITRDLVIDGKGYTFTTPSAVAFTLGDTKKVNKTFELANLTVEYTAKTSSFIQSADTASQYWSVRLANISGSTPEKSNAGAYFSNVRRGSIEINGNFNWYSKKTVPSLASDKAVFSAANIYITNGARVNVTAAHAIARIYPNVTSIDTSFVVDQGSKVNLDSELRQVVWANTEGSNNALLFSVTGAGTEVNATSKGTFYGADGGVITLQGSAEAGRNTRTEILDGAVVNAYAKASEKEAGKANPSTTSAFTNQVKSGVFNIDGENSALNLTADGEAHNYCATLRFRLVGEQTFSITNNAELNIVKNSGAAAAVRMYGKDNSFIAKSGGKVNIYKKGTNRAQNGGDTGGQQAVQFTLDGGGISYFEVQDENSIIYAKSDDGPALEALSGNFKFIIGEESTFRMEGKTYDSNRGIVHSGSNKIDVKIDAPIFYDFRNNRVNGGQVFSTGSSSSGQTFSSTGVSLSVWKKKTGVDLDANPDTFWGKIDYELSGANFKNIVRAEFPEQFNSTTYEGANNYTRMTGNNYQAVVDELRVPTNADKTIYGHVSVPYSIDGSESRDAWENEVWVTVQILDREGNEKAKKIVPTKGQNDQLPGVSIYGEKARGGIFCLELSDFLSAGDQVKVIAAYRGGSDDETSSQNIHSEEDRLQTETVIVQDVTPPIGLASDTKTVSDTTKQLTGTIDLWDKRDKKQMDKVFIFVKIGNEFAKDAEGNFMYHEVTMENESASEDNPTLKKWTINLPHYLKLGDSVEIFAKDTLETMPEIIGDLPGTLTTEPNNLLGNITPSKISYENYKGYHDAIGKDRFTPSLLFDVIEAAPSSPVIKIDVPVGFDRNDENIPILTLNNQLLYEITVSSGDKLSSGKDPVKNLLVSVSMSEQLDYDLQKLQENAAIKKIVNNGSSLDIYFNSDLKAGESLSFSLSALVKDDTQAVTTVATVIGDSTVEEPFIIGPPDEGNNHKKLTASDEVSVVPGVKKETGEKVYLTVVNNRLKIFYSNIEEFTVYLDGEEYKKYQVAYKKTTDSKILDIPVDEIRNKISIKYKDKTEEKWTYWNNNWDFVTE